MRKLILLVPVRLQTIASKEKTFKPKLHNKMNSCITVIVVVASILSGSSNAQESGACGCGSQPTIIQMSCNGGAPVWPIQHPPAPFHPPSPPAQPPSAQPPSAQPTPSPSGNHTQASSDPSTWNIDPKMCEVDQSGYPLHQPAGGWPAGYRMLWSCAAGGFYACSKPEISVDDLYQEVPHHDWDDRLSTLGFNIVPGTPTFNMIMCWPVRATDGVHEWTGWGGEQGHLDYY